MFGGECLKSLMNAFGRLHYPTSSASKRTDQRRSASVTVIGTSIESSKSSILKEEC